MGMTMRQLYWIGLTYIHYIYLNANDFICLWEVDIDISHKATHFNNGYLLSAMICLNPSFHAFFPFFCSLQMLHWNACYGIFFASAIGLVGRYCKAKVFTFCLTF